MKDQYKSMYAIGKTNKQKWRELKYGKVVVTVPPKKRNPYYRRQPTAKTAGTVFRDAIYKTPIFPASRFQRKMLYYDNGQTLTGTAGVVNTDFYSANGLYDPDITGAGHQPIGFDQLMLLYTTYAVIRSKITVNFYNYQATNPCRVGIYLSPDATGITDPVKLVENGLISSVLVNTPGSSTSLKQITLDCDVKKYFSKRRYSDIKDSRELTGTSAANPTEGVYFGVCGWDMSNEYTLSVKYDVCIEYDAYFFEPRKLNIS